MCSQFEGLLGCGILARAFGRVHCSDCGYDRLVPGGASHLCPGSLALGHGRVRLARKRPFSDGTAHFVVEGRCQ